MASKQWKVYGVSLSYGVVTIAIHGKSNHKYTRWQSSGDSGIVKFHIKERYYYKIKDLLHIKDQVSPVLAMYLIKHRMKSRDGVYDGNTYPNRFFRHSELEPDNDIESWINLEV